MTDQYTKSFQVVIMTDLVGSTKLYETYGDTHAKKIVDEHDRILEPIIEKYDGITVKKLGDAILARFPSVDKSLQASIEIQKLLKETNERKEEKDKIVIKIGMHWGEVILQSGDVFGDVVNTSKRLESLAAGYLIIVSEELRNNCSLELSFVPMGSFSVKGKKEPVKTYGVIWDTSDILITKYETRKKQLQKEEFKLNQKKEFHSISLGHANNAPLEIITNPPDVKVTLNKQVLSQTTPITCNYKTGITEIILECPGYKTIVDKILIEDSMKNSFQFELVAQFARIDLTNCESNMDIYINDQFQAQKTPCIIENLTAGEYTLQLKNKNFISKKYRFTLFWNETRKEEFKVFKPVQVCLVSQFNEVDFNIREVSEDDIVRENLEISPNRQFIKGVSKTVSLTPGQYQLTPIDSELPDMIVDIPYEEQYTIEYDHQVCTRKLTIDYSNNYYNTSISFLKQKNILKFDKCHKIHCNVPPCIVSLKIESIGKRINKLINLTEADKDIVYNDLFKVKPSKHWIKSTILVSFLLVLVLVLSFISSNILWKKLERTNDIKSIQRFMLSPISLQNHKNAKQRLAELEIEYYNRVKQSDDIMILQSYISFYPEGKHVNECIKLVFEKHVKQMLNGCKVSGVCENIVNTKDYQSLLVSKEQQLYRRFKKNPSIINAEKYITLFPDSNQCIEILKLIQKPLLRVKMNEENRCLFVALFNQRNGLKLSENDLKKLQKKEEMFRKDSHNVGTLLSSLKSGMNDSLGRSYIRNANPDLRILFHEENLSLLVQGGLISLKWYSLKYRLVFIVMSSILALSITIVFLVSLFKKILSI